MAESPLPAFSKVAEVPEKSPHVLEGVDAIVDMVIVILAMANRPREGVEKA